MLFQIIRWGGLASDYIIYPDFIANHLRRIQTGSDASGKLL